MKFTRPVIAGAIAATIAVPAGLALPHAHAASKQEAFIAAIAPYAQESMRLTGVPASVTIAQASVESGWGESELARNANAYFGVKCKEGGDNGPYAKGCYTKLTKEFVNGEWITISAPFRKYASKRDSVLDHGDFLKTRSHYAAAFQYTNDPDQFIREVHKGGYATAPDYADAMIRQMRDHDLYKYDKLPATPAPTPKPTTPAPKPTPTPTKPAPKPSAGVQTVDNATAGRFTASANWGTSAYDSRRVGADYRFAKPQPVSDAAWYRFDVAKAGRYRIEVSHPAGSGYSSAAPHVIQTAHGPKTVMVDQTVRGGQWTSLGEFELAAGDRNVVAISRWTSAPGLVIADAVRLTPLD